MGRDGVRFEIVGRVRFDKAVRSIKICLGLSRAQRRKLMTTLLKRTRMSKITSIRNVKECAAMTEFILVVTFDL